MVKWYKIFDTIAVAEERVPLNQSVRVIIKGHKICLARIPDGFMAIDDECPHLGDSLSRGHINYLGEITCPWHSYRYNLKTGLECQNRSKEVATHLVKANENGLFIGLDSTE